MQEYFEYIFENFKGGSCGGGGRKKGGLIIKNKIN